MHSSIARRTFRFSGLILLAAAACGQGNSGASPEASPSPEPSVAAPSSASPSAAADAGMRTVTDAYGETTIPADPQRIVVLTSGALDNLLALGVKPVGAPYSISVNANFFSYLADRTDGVENTGTVDQPNLETVAKLKPDLIIGQKSDHDAVYADLKRIAPVYMVDMISDKWKDSVLGNADAVNKRAEGERLIAEYEAKIAKFKEDAGDKLSTLTVSLIRPRADHVRIYTDGSFSGAVAKEAGVTRPANQAGVAEHNVAITEEQIAEMDADLILSFGRETEAEYFENKIKKSPLWATLKAVQNNQVHMLDWEVWLSGQGIQAANLMVDDLIRIFGV